MIDEIVWPLSCTNAVFSRGSDYWDEFNQTSARTGPRFVLGTSFGTRFYTVLTRGKWGWTELRVSHPFEKIGAKSGG